MAVKLDFLVLASNHEFQYYLLVWLLKFNLILQLQKITKYYQNMGGATL